MTEMVQIIEVGPRDGLQIANGIMPTAKKIAWIEAMFDAGLRTIEVGSFVPPKLVSSMADTEQVVRALRDSRPSLNVVVLAPNLKGAIRAVEAGVHGIIVPVSVSEGHSLANTGKRTSDQISEFGRVVEWVRGHGGRTVVEAGCITAFGCSIDGSIPLRRVVEVAVALAQAGADRIVLADTVGYGNPKQIRETIAAVRREVGARLDRLHLHDTLGLGIANALVGIDEGIRRFDTSLAGLGGCPFAPGAAGNIVTEDLVFMMESIGFSTGVSLSDLLRTRNLLADGLPCEPLRGSLAQAGVPRVYREARADKIESWK